MSKLYFTRTYRTLVSMFGLMCLSLTIGPVWAQDEPVPFACTGDAYTVRATPAELFRIDQDVTPFQFYPIGGPLTGPFGPVGEEIPIQVNNLGYSFVDNLLYAVALDAEEAQENYGIIQLDSNGNVFPVGVPIGLPVDVRFLAGDVSTDGRYLYINTYPSSTLYTVDLDTLPLTAVPIDLTGGPVNVADWAYNPDDGKLYGASGVGPTAATGGEIFQLDPVAGVISSVGQPNGLPLAPSGPSSFYGGAWFDANGTLFLYRNNDFIYTIDLTGPTITNGQLGGAGISLYNDATACAAGTLIEKFYTYTNNDWSMRCAVYDQGECLEDRLPNINVDDDIFADPLPQNTEGDFVLLGKELRHKTVITPGQYFAVSNIEARIDQDVLVREDFRDCTDIGTVNPFSVPGGVQVVLVDASGDVYEIGGELANGNGGSIVLTPDYADVYVENVPAGSTLRVMVKFKPLDEPEMVGRSCTNYEILLDDNISASAVLTVEPK